MSIRDSIKNIEDGKVRDALNKMIDYLEGTYNSHTHSISGSTSSTPTNIISSIIVSDQNQSKIE